MSSLAPETIFRTVPDGRTMDAILDELIIRSVVADVATVEDITVGTLNGQPIAGPFVFTAAVQTLTNKSLVDTSTRIVDATDSTIAIAFDAAGSAGTVGTLRFSQTASAVYTVPPTAASFVMTEGDQTINGAKTFATLAVGTISEAVANAGTTVDGVRLRSGAYATPTSQDFIDITPIGAAAKISVAICPKGVGAITSEIPTGAVSGGAMRGDYAVDFQRQRTVAANVASGTLSFIGGGIDNRCEAAESVTCGGRGNNNAGANSFIGGGRDGSTTVAATYAAIVAGDGNAISASNASIVAGADNTVSGAFGHIPYGSNCQVTAPYGRASGQYARAIHNNSVVLRGRDSAVNFDSTVANQHSTDFDAYRTMGGPHSWNDRSVMYTDGAIQTVGAATANLFDITTDLNTVNFFTVNITGVIPGGDVFMRRVSIHTKNLAGNLDLRSEFDSWTVADPSVPGAAVTFLPVVARLIVQVTGTIGQTMTWRGEVVKRVSAGF